MHIVYEYLILLLFTFIYTFHMHDYIYKWRFINTKKFDFPEDAQTKLLSSNGML